MSHCDNLIAFADQNNCCFRIKAGSSAGDCDSILDSVHFPLCLCMLRRITGVRYSEFAVLPAVTCKKGFYGEQNKPDDNNIVDRQ